MKDSNGNYYRNGYEMKRANGLITVGNETFPLTDEGKFVFQVSERAGYEMPSGCTPGTEADAQADMDAWVECYPDADCRVVEIS